MCSVQPRCGSGRQLKNINEEMVNLDDYMRAACRRSKKAMLIDTSPSLVNTDGSAAKRMFSKYYHSAHLNNTGRVEVISTIMAHLTNHPLCTCDFYNKLRVTLFQNNNSIEPSVINILTMLGIDLITFLMNDKCVKYVADFISNAWYKRENALFN